MLESLLELLGRLCLTIWPSEQQLVNFIDFQPLVYSLLFAMFARKITGTLKTVPCRYRFSALIDSMIILKTKQFNQACWC